MKIYWLRSTIFNFLFYTLTALSCVICLPFLWMPRRAVMGLVNLYLEIVFFLERHVLRLFCEVRGAENLPAHPPYLIAAKHQSAYETFKLHFLFGDPAIILKKELLKIPLWGAYLKKTDVIAIDRSTPDKALKSIESGAKRVSAQGRPIVIFPQGTRVRTEETPKDKPYKAGIARIQNVTNLPIIPMATNSGFFWPRKGWFKRPGSVVFQFLEPIPPGLRKNDLMQNLERRIEDASEALLEEAKIQEEKRPRRKKLKIALLVFLLSLACLYSAFWFYAAAQIKIFYAELARGAPEITRDFTPPVISGFPGAFQIHVSRETLKISDSTVAIENIAIKAWPFPFLDSHIQTGNLSFKSNILNKTTLIDSLSAFVSYDLDFIQIKDGKIRHDDFLILLSGKVDPAKRPHPDVEILVELPAYKSFMKGLVKKELIQNGYAVFIIAALSPFDLDDTARVPLTLKNSEFFVGGLKVASLP